MAEVIAGSVGQQPTKVGNYYRWTLTLASIYALTELTWALIVYFYTSHIDSGYIVRVVIGLIIPVGIFLSRKFLRYAGGVYFVVNAASVIWPMLTASLVWNVGLIWVFAIGLLSLPLIWFLLISREFSTEFSALRNTEPKYKETLRTVMWIAVAVTMIIATFFDIVKLASG
jgi:hypothetical protein